MLIFFVTKVHKRYVVLRREVSKFEHVKYVTAETKKRRRGKERHRKRNGEIETEREKNQGTNQRFKEISRFDT